MSASSDVIILFALSAFFVFFVLLKDKIKDKKPPSKIRLIYCRIIKALHWITFTVSVVILPFLFHEISEVPTGGVAEGIYVMILMFISLIFIIIALIYIVMFVRKRKQYQRNKVDD